MLLRMGTHRGTSALCCAYAVVVVRPCNGCDEPVGGCFKKVLPARLLPQIQAMPCKQRGPAHTCPHTPHPCRMVWLAGLMQGSNACSASQDCSVHVCQEKLQQQQQQQQQHDCRQQEDDQESDCCQGGEEDLDEHLEAAEFIQVRHCD